MARRLRATLRTHWLLALALTAGLVMRVLVDVAYWPSLLFFGDSYAYLRAAQRLHPQAAHPIGYPALLRLLSITGSIAVVPIVQHLLGLGLGVVIYLLMLRLGVRRSLAAAAAMPVLLGGFQLDIEQFVLAETLTDVLLLAGLALLLWRWRLGAGGAALVGALLAGAALTRTAALAVVVVVGLYLLTRRSWRATGGYALAVLITVGAYASWDAAVNGGSPSSGMSGYFLYGRVAPFATCDYPLQPRLRQLCPPLPVSVRSRNPELYVWEPGSPLAAPDLGSLGQRDGLAMSFSERVILHQPLAYLEAAAADTWHYFTPGRWMSPRTDSIDVQRWQFPGPGLQPERDQLHVFLGNAGFGGRPVTPQPDFALTGFLRAYQSVLYLPGPALLTALLGAAAVGAGLTGIGIARRRGRPASRSAARWAALVLAASGVVLVAIPSLVTGFSYRYGLPLLVLLPPAGLIAADIGADALVGEGRPLPRGAGDDRDSPAAGDQERAPDLGPLDRRSTAASDYALRADGRPSEG
ncbi:MAG: hypothetical protein ACRDYD_10350 [Acidimicrobiales bacterium]